MIIADKIVSLRKRAGWSQEELAEKLGPPVRFQVGGRSVGARYG